MFDETARRSVRGRDGLPLLLLVSLLLHLSLIALPVPGRASGGARSASDFRSSSLHASLNYAPAVPAPLSRQGEPVADSAPAFEPAPRAGTRADDDAPLRQPGLVFYPSAVLTSKPVALDEPQLEDGDTASGEQVLTLWIDDQGVVVEASAERSEYSADRRNAFTEAFRRVRFAPGELNGQKVGAVLRIAVNYDDEPLPVEP
jgi:hypothetical protein